MPNLNTNTYQPRGSTALIDAIGRTIYEVGEKLSKMPEHERPGQVIVCVITDGQENASTEYVSCASVVHGHVIKHPFRPFGPPMSGVGTRQLVGNKFARVQAMISHQRENYQWEFVFLGANEDGIAQAAGSLGFQHVYSYAATPLGSQQVFGAMSRGISSYLNAGNFSIGDAEGIKAVVTPESSGSK